MCPRLLDLFCCAGGAAKGYNQAGFDIVGVDITPQPNYPFPFVQADALQLDPKFLLSFDAVHASPPCQSYSVLAKRTGNGSSWPRLIKPVREMLVRSGLPYVIENVVGAPLLNPIQLCGTMFPGLRVLRHRLFEVNFEVVPPPILHIRKCTPKTEEKLILERQMNGKTMFRLPVAEIAPFQRHRMQWGLIG